MIHASQSIPQLWNWSSKLSQLITVTVLSWLPCNPPESDDVVEIPIEGRQTADPSQTTHQMIQNKTFSLIPAGKTNVILAET